MRPKLDCYIFNMHGHYNRYIYFYAISSCYIAISTKRTAILSDDDSGNYMARTISRASLYNCRQILLSSTEMLWEPSFSGWGKQIGNGTGR